MYGSFACTEVINKIKLFLFMPAKLQIIKQDIKKPIRSLSCEIRIF